MTATLSALAASTFTETFGLPCQDAVIVRFSKKPPITFEVKELADVKRSLEAFLAEKALKEALEKPQFIDW